MDRQKIKSIWLYISFEQSFKCWNGKLKATPAQLQKCKGRSRGGAICILAMKSSCCMMHFNVKLYPISIDRWFKNESSNFSRGGVAVLYAELKYIKIKNLYRLKIYFHQTSGQAIYFQISQKIYFISLGPGPDFSYF